MFCRWVEIMILVPCASDATDEIDNGCFAAVASVPKYPPGLLRRYDLNE